MSTILALLGSGEFTDPILPVDEHLSKLTAKNQNLSSADLKIAILPTAAGREWDFSKWIDMGIAHFTQLGIEAYGVPVISSTDAENPEFVESISVASMIYISGGDPGYLLHCLKGSRLWQEIHKKFLAGTTIAASSAGAMALGQYTFTNPYQASSAHVTPKWEPGLGLTTNSVIPHFDFLRRNESRLLKNLHQFIPPEINQNICGIDEDTALIEVNQKPVKIIGRGHVYRLFPVVKKLNL